MSSGVDDDTKEETRQQEWIERLFQPNVESGFPEPISGVLDTEEEREAYDVVLEKALTITKPWAWKETDMLYGSEWRDYMCALLFDPVLSMSITPWRQNNPAGLATWLVVPQKPSSEWGQLVLWLASLDDNSSDIISYLLYRWYLDNTNDHPVERVLFCHKKFINAHTTWNQTCDMSKVPEWLHSIALPSRAAQRPLHAMMNLELFCQLALAMPQFMVHQLKALKHILIDLYIARAHMLTLVQQVLPVEQTFTCIKDKEFCVAKRVFVDTDLSYQKHSGNPPFHGLVCAWQIEETIGTIPSTHLHCLPRLPCGCCKVPVGASLVSWIRWWLRPGMVVYEAKQHHKEIGKLVCSTWEPHYVRCIKLVTERSTKKRKSSDSYELVKNMILCTSGSDKYIVSDKWNDEWMLVSMEDEAEDGADKKKERDPMSMHCDDFGFYFKKRYSSGLSTRARIIPLVGFGPAYVALAAKTEVLRYTGLPVVLAHVVYEYMINNI